MEFYFDFKSFTFLILGSITVLFVYSPSIQAQTQLTGYGDTCNYDCDHSKYLICFHGKCNCTNPETMVYDETVGTCAVASGYPCHQEETYTEALHHSANVVVVSRTVKIKRKLPCAYGGVCVLNKCEDVYQPMIEYDDPHNHAAEIHCDYAGKRNCPADSGLNCINGYCRCSHGAQQYFNGVKCVSRVNGICKAGQWECTPNADCVASGADHSTCQCQTGFRLDDNGMCMPDYQQPCDNRQLFCNGRGRLACVNGKCECETEFHVWDAEIQMCQGLVGSSCQIMANMDEFEFKNLCVRNAFCDGLKGEINGFCKCKRGFSMAANRTCTSKDNKVV